MKLIEELKGKLSRTTEHTVSAEERSRMMDAAMAAEEKQQETLKNEISQTSTLKMRRAEELGDMKQRKRHMDTEIHVQRDYNILFTKLWSTRIDYIIVEYRSIQLYSCQSVQ